MKYVVKYRKEVNGKTIWSRTYSEYPSFEEAQAAADTFNDHARARDNIEFWPEEVVEWWEKSKAQS